MIQIRVTIKQLPSEERLIGAVLVVMTLLSVLLSSTAAYGQGNHVFEGVEKVNFGTLDLATPGGQTWSTYRGATPGYFSAVGTASYTSPADADANVNGYVKHYADAANQSFSFPVGTGTDYRELTVSGTRAASSEVAVAWIVGDPTSTTDPTAPNAGTHAVATMGAGITGVSPVGQWDWQDLSSDAAGVTVTVSIPDMSAFASAGSQLRLAGWDGTEWVNLSGTTGASGTAENSTLSGTMIAGLTALGIGKNETYTDFGDNTAFASVSATYTDANTDGTPDGGTSVWLGTTVTAETTDPSNGTATGDGGDDGFTTPPATGATSVDHTITLNAAGATTVHYYIRMVTTAGTVNQPGSHTFAAAGSTTITWSPASLAGYTGLANYRVVVASSSADALAAITGTSFTNGEVEDYQITYVDPLPVELISQEVVWAGDDALVTWSTASELNNERFEIYRSFDGRTFEFIGEHASKAVNGNSTAILKYHFVDPVIRPQTAKYVYYQIKQIDYNGDSERFDVMPLYNGDVTELAVELYPNPSESGKLVNLRAIGLTDEIANIIVYNTLGVAVHSQQETNVNGAVVSLDLASLSSGVYNVELSQGTNKVVKRLVIQ